MLSKCREFVKDCLTGVSKSLLGGRQNAHKLAYDLIKKTNDYAVIRKCLAIPDKSLLPKQNDSFLPGKYIRYDSIRSFERSEKTGDTLLNYSKKEWPLFIQGLTDKISITLGYRKAFSEDLPFPMYHLILLVTDSEHKVGLFGYHNSKTGSDYIRNDSVNNFSNYIFYPDLIIHGTRDQVKSLFNMCEERSAALPYNGICNNCYSPIFFSLLEAKTLGFDVPKRYKDNILLITTREQNRGMGIIYNSHLSTFFKSSVEKVINKARIKGMLPENNAHYLLFNALFIYFSLCIIYKCVYKTDNDNEKEENISNAEQQFERTIY